MNLTLKMQLLSDTTFGRGDGVVGLVDEEIEHDPVTGLPIVRGRTLKGILVEECANCLFAVGASRASGTLRRAAAWLFGAGGSTSAEGSHMHIGAAELPEDLCKRVRATVNRTPVAYSASDILGSLTTIRRQTAVNEVTGAPQEGSLRSSRAVLRGLVFDAPIDFDQEPDPHHLALLSACAASVRRAGSGRNRGRGRVRTWIEGPGFDFNASIELFERLVRDSA
ncbi:MAG: hypothetical protein IT323_20455 [Anaerolineae bacterium]|nr:hypothetical protein [Anaerolineae bacterium]